MGRLLVPPGGRVKRAPAPPRAAGQDASPQVGKGHGHTEVSNELLEAIARFPFTGPQLRVLLFVVRDSYGWKRKETRAYTFSELGETLDLTRGTAHRAVAELKDLGVIQPAQGGGWALVKNYNAWGSGPMLPLSIVPLVGRPMGGTDERPTGETKASTGGTDRPTSGTPYGERKVKKKERDDDARTETNGKDTPRRRAALGHPDMPPDEHHDFRQLPFPLRGELTEQWKAARDKERKRTACRKCQEQPRASEAWPYCRECTVCHVCTSKADGTRKFQKGPGGPICTTCADAIR